MWESGVAMFVAREYFILPSRKTMPNVLPITNMFRNKSLHNTVKLSQGRRKLYRRDGWRKLYRRVGSEKAEILSWYLTPLWNRNRNTSRYSTFLTKTPWTTLLLHNCSTILLKQCWAILLLQQCCSHMITMLFNEWINNFISFRGGEAC